MICPGSLESRFCQHSTSQNLRFTEKWILEALQNPNSCSSGKGSFGRHSSIPKAELFRKMEFGVALENQRPPISDKGILGRLGLAFQGTPKPTTTEKCLQLAQTIKKKPSDKGIFGRPSSTPKPPRTDFKMDFWVPFKYPKLFLADQAMCGMRSSTPQATQKQSRMGFGSSPPEHANN